ncbi:MAG: CHAD domain-containing protein [Chitinophagaceae bacterium]|nr:CHAD domain-containing protein [Chitinophagaceae bacterium]
MSADNPLTRYGKKQEGIARIQLNRLRIRTQGDALHDWRVAVKKIRAAVKLGIALSGITDSPDRLKGTESLFACSGKRRDVEICLELVNQYPLRAGSLTHFLRSQKRATGIRFREALIKYSGSETGKATGWLKSTTGKLMPGELEKRLQTQIALLSAEALTESGKPHRLRKHLKTLYYWYDIAGVSGPPKEKLNHLCEQLGEWQDREVCQTLLRHYRKDYLSAADPESVLIKEFETTLETENKKRQQKIRSALRSWLKLSIP